jgi:hypothetical protein
MSERSPHSDRSRIDRIHAIQVTRLGGIDRIVLDHPNDEPFGRYAHICQNGLTTTVHTTDDPRKQDDAYGPEWEHVGVIDLDTGDVVDARSDEKRDRDA